jgi:hypothetical protein
MTQDFAKIKYLEKWTTTLDGVPQLENSSALKDGYVGYDIN